MGLTVVPVAVGVERLPPLLFFADLPHASPHSKEGCFPESLNSLAYIHVFSLFFEQGQMVFPDTISRISSFAKLTRAYSP